MSKFAQVLGLSHAGRRLSEDEVFALLEGDDLPAMIAIAAELRDRGHGPFVSYSGKVFIPLTQLCRDSYLTPEEVLAIAQTGAKAGCREALFTLGDKPQRRYRAARDELAALRYQTTISYLAAMAALVLKRTGLLPHINAGVITADELAMLRAVSASQGLMLETSAQRLGEKGGPHFGSPDKRPSVRLR
jgi:FO synthase